MVYHGTSQERWADSTPNQWRDLYVTDDLHIAVKYASEWLDNGETPLVLALDLDAVMALPVTLVPNEENVEQCANGHWLGVTKPIDELTWRDTRAMSGTFAIRDFSHEHKSIAVPVPAHMCGFDWADAPIRTENVEQISVGGAVFQR